MATGSCPVRTTSRSNATFDTHFKYFLDLEYLEKLVGDVDFFDGKDSGTRSGWLIGIALGVDPSGEWKRARAACRDAGVSPQPLATHVTGP